MQRLFLILFLLFSQVAAAQTAVAFLSGLSEAPIAGPSNRISFIGPNEESPTRALALLRQAPRDGVLISVGSERGWITAALLDDPNGFLLALDSDADVIRFHRVNRTLLQVARDRSDYLQLRMVADWNSWQRRIATSKELGERAKADAIPLWGWWRDRVRCARPDVIGGANLLHWRDFYSVPRPELGEACPFQGANYLYDDALFARVQRLARDGRVKALQIDLRDTERLRRLGRALVDADEGHGISVLDISNAWSREYMKEREVLAIVDALAPAAYPDGFLLMTAPLEEARPPYYRFDWAYFGFTFSSLTSHRGEASSPLTATLRSPGRQIPYGFHVYPELRAIDGKLFRE